MRTLIENCRIVSPGVDRSGTLELEGGRIQGIHAESPKPSAQDRIIDGKGHRVLPGFIDLHIHGAMGFDVTDGTLEAIEAIARAKLAEGVTTFCPTTLTLPERRLRPAFEAVARYEKRQQYAKIAGIHLEGPFINADRAGAQNRRYVRVPDLQEVLRLHAVSRIAIVTFAIEEEGGVPFTRALRDHGIVPSCGHSAATYAQFLEAKSAGLGHLTHFCNQMSELHHREIGLVGAGLLDDDILLELICDKIHLCPEMIALAFKRIPLERIALVADAMCAAGLGEGEYTLGELQVLVKNGAARLVEDDALAGSVLHLNEALKNVHEITGLPLHELVCTTAFNQARSLSLEGLGKIEAGYVADLVLLDEAFEVKAVFVNGEQRI